MFKKTFTLLLGTIMTVSLFAADVAGRITVSFTGNNNYELLIDGRRYYSNNNRLLLNDVRPGRHTVEVYALQRANRRVNRPVYATTFTVRPQYDMHLTVDRNGRVHFEESRSYNRDKNGRDWNDRDGRDRDWNDRNNQDWDRNDNRWDNNYSRALSEHDYNQVVQQVRSQWTASRKYSAAKDAVTRYHFTTQQVRGLLQLLSSESQRLDVAKLAYHNTVDQRNYNDLYNLFSRNAQRELDGYTRNSRY